MFYAKPAKPIIATPLSRRLRVPDISQIVKMVKATKNFYIIMVRNKIVYCRCDKLAYVLPNTFEIKSISFQVRDCHICSLIFASGRISNSFEDISNMNSNASSFPIHIQNGRQDDKLYRISALFLTT